MNEVRLGDCMELMKELPDKSVDMILCDLPYGVTQNKWDSIIDLKLLWEQYKKIIKNNGVIVLTAQTPFDKVLGCSNLKMLKYEWIWEKEQGTGHLNAKKMPLKNHENILVFYNKLPTYNPIKVGSENRNIQRSGNKLNTTNYGTSIQPKSSSYQGRYPKTIIKIKRDKGLHPTQKPVALFEYLIKTYTNEGDLILDNCVGSGTTNIACLNTNRQCIGMEKDEKYFKIATKRLENCKKQAVLEGTIR